jgi:hypothetical protein
MDVTITYDEVATLVGVNIHPSIRDQILSKSEYSAATLSKRCNASHAHKAPYMGGKAW